MTALVRGSSSCKLLSCISRMFLKPQLTQRDRTFECSTREIELTISHLGMAPVESGSILWRYVPSYQENSECSTATSERRISQTMVTVVGNIVSISEKSTRARESLAMLELIIDGQITLLLCRRRSPSAAVSQVTSSQSPAQLCPTCTSSIKRQKNNQRFCTIWRLVTAPDAAPNVRRSMTKPWVSACETIWVERRFDPTLDATLPGSHWKRPGRKIAADAEHESPPGSEGSTYVANMFSGYFSFHRTRQRRCSTRESHTEWGWKRARP